MSFSVNKEPLVWITVRDGTKLAAKLWLPDADKSEKFPAILEFLPYRRVDWTAQRDEKSHSYFCCHGYVCIRVDMRGSGDSEGYYYDEYEGQEQEDCCDVISWISRQEWCNGNVGLSNACKQDVWPGKWIAEDLWPSSNIQNQEFELHGDRSLRLAPVKDDEKSPVNEAVSVKSSFLSGAWGGLPLAFSLDELPMDQRLEDPLSECWETATLSEPVVIVGFPEVRLQLSSDSPCALVAVRLCDVFPNGESSLISRGVFNLTHRNGHAEGVIQPLTPHETFQVQFKLDSTAYKVSAGHKIRLALSSVHWPLVWPSPLATSLSVQTGSPSTLLLPARIGQGRDAELRAFETPGYYNHAVLPVEWRRNPRKARYLEISQLSEEYKLTVVLDDGCVLLKDTNTIYDETNTETFTIKDGEPKTAKVSIRGHVTMKKDSEAAGQEECELNPLWDTRVEAISEMWSDEQFFYLKSQLTAWHGSEECFYKTWTKKIGRFYL